MAASRLDTPEPIPCSEGPPTALVALASLRDLAAAVEGLDGTDLITLLRADQRRRWLAGRAFPVESYLACLPGLREQAAAVVDLIAAEFSLRREIGQVPSSEEYCDRFPDLADSVRARLEGPSQAVADSAATGPYIPADGERWPAVPGYEILGELGKGGMGVVYKARHLGLKRLVALKMIRVGPSHTADRLRFRAEAEAVARLQHPHIVQVYDVGDCEGQPYCALEYVGGGSLDRYLKGRLLAPSEAAALVEQLARAMHAVHGLHLVHRDLKPANILLVATGDGPSAVGPADSESSTLPQGSGRKPMAAKITDFGLAKFLDDASPELSHAGAVMGTPSYMAPEQAAGQARDVTPAADVYALGAILYECLTGRPPFKGATVAETLAQVREREPVPPSRLQPAVPRDLEAICLKCLEKPRARRYASAADLADDLARLRAGQPTVARPAGAIERGLKWVRRNKARAAAAVFLALALLGGGVGGSMAALYLRAERARQETDIARGLEEQSRKEAEGTRDQLAIQKDQTEQARQQEQKAKEEAITLREQLVLVDYANVLDLAARDWQANRVADARRRVTGADEKHRRWEWDYLRQLCHPELHILAGHSGAVKALAYFPDGRRLASGGFDKTIRIWDTASGKLLGTDVRPRGTVYGLAYTPDGRYLVAVADSAKAGDAGTVTVWEPTDGDNGMALALRRTLTAPNTTFSSIALSPDGRHIAAAGYERVTLPSGGPGVTTAVIREQTQHLIQVWDVADGTPVRTIPGAGRFMSQVSYSPDGRRLATCDADKSVRVRDAATGKELYALPSQSSIPAADVTFSPDGRLLAWVGPDQSVHIADARDGRKVRALVGHTGRVQAVAFSPDSRLLASAGDDRTVKLWDSQSGQEVVTLQGYPRGIFRLAFSPDGQRLAGGGTDNSVQVWDLTRFPGPVSLTVPLPLNGARYDVFAVAFSPDGRRVVSGSGDDTARVWDVATGLELRTLKGDNHEVRGVACSRDGRWIASTCCTGRVFLWDAVTGEQVRVLERYKTGSMYSTVAFSPDGRRLAAANSAGSVTIWDTADGRVVAHWVDLGTGSRGVAFSPDGRRLAAGGGAGARLFVWQLPEQGQETALAPPLTLAHHQVSVTGVAFSPDGRRLVSVGADYKVCLWDLAEDQAGPGAPAPVWSVEASYLGRDLDVAFSPDGYRVVVGRGVACSSDGACLAAAGAVALFDTESGVRVFLLETPLATQDRSRPVILWPARDTSEQQAGRWKAWPEQQARHSEENRQWFAAAFHLTPAVRARPDDWALLLRRGTAYAEAEAWDRAAADFAQAIAIRPTDWWFHLRLGLTQLAQGDLPSYRRTCTRLAKGALGTKEAGSAQLALMLAILAPGALQEADQFVALADASAVGQPPGVQRTANLGAALYRAGRYKEALEKLTEAVRQTDAKNPAPPIRLLFLAMTHHQLGQTEESRKLLDQAVQRMDQTAPLPSADWTTRLAIRPLRQEAEALIQPKP